MAKKIEGLPNDKPFLLIEGIAKEFMLATGNDLKYMHICPRCGTPVTHLTRVIYVAVLDQILCVKCADRWLESARWYSEEVKTEQCNYKAMMQKLKDSKLWVE